MCYTPEKEVWIRKTALRLRLAAIDGVQIPDGAQNRNILTTDWFWSNKEEFAGTMGITGANNIKALEVKFALIDYANFVDTGDGTKKCPVVNINYDLTLAWQFRNVRENGTNSKDDLIALAARVFSDLTGNNRLDADTRIISVSQPSPISKPQRLDLLPDDKAKCRVINLKIVVEVR